MPEHTRRIDDALAARLRDALPGADLTRAVQIGEGWGTEAYRVPDRTPGAPGDWALRLRRGEAFRAVTGDLQLEVTLLPRLASRGLPTPREARGIHDAGSTLVATVHRLIEGEPATRARLGRGARRVALAGALGDFLTRLHAVPRAEAQAAGARTLDLWRDRYAPMFAAHRALLGPRSRAWLDATAARFVAEGGTRGAPRVLVHGDLAPQHILLAPDGALVGVIDFGDAMIADPAIDFGGLLLAYGWPFTEEVLASYGGRVDAHFRRRMRFYVDVVPIFLVAFGHLFHGGQDRADGLRQFAARAGRDSVQAPSRSP